MKNWKTSLSGIAAFACLIGAHFLPQYHDALIQLAIALGGAGLIGAKDHNVTGGTKEQ